ncbi:taurine ABC transporter ATP-binding subunit [Acinetobacter guillouiae]|uniref:taurine ABC transporter ATP-binding subunit n=1 Tax=Acinetobacter TaxID=469 RepID=UPI001FBB60BE|nr:MULTISPECIES: taurine ABC transporter ATP-binding subunit [Acinetobacter]UOH18584.1 taurine ABC transporter ATP-binding subunit [Acinetobacter sp. NyZ410]
MAVLTVEHVQAQYPGAEQPVLKDVSFQLGSEQLMVALGASGSGKTTLLNLIAGFTQPQAGTLKLDGEVIIAPSRDRGVVFQDDVLLPWQNVEDNIAFGLELAGVDKKTRQNRAQALLKLVNLEGFGQRHIWELSGGQRQRVGLARALASDPKILLMDEPFGALDAFIREQMQCLLLDVWKSTSKPTFLITHDIEEAVFLATDLIILAPNPGRIVEKLELDFAKRYANGEPARSIKSDPKFIEMREHVLSCVFIQNNQDQYHVAQSNQAQVEKVE